MKNIVLIDDDEDDHVFFKTALRTIYPTLHCEIATNGKTALEELRTSHILPHIIFIDLNMPVMNGRDFLVQIKKDDKLKEIPVGIFSTSNLIHDKELAKELGARFFMTKPNDLQVLRKKLQQILLADFSTEEYITIT